MQVGQYYFHAAPRSGKDDRLNVVGSQVLGQPHAFQQRAFTETQGFIDDGGIIEQEVALPAPGAVLVDKLNRSLDQSLTKFPRVADCSGGENELRLCTIKPGDAFQPAYHVGNMRAEDTAVGVHFVDDDEAQALEEIRPVGVMRQNAGVKHVGIG